MTLLAGLARAQPAPGELGSIELQSDGARLGTCEILDFQAADYAPTRVGNVCYPALGADVTQLGMVIGDAGGELQSGTTLPASCETGEIYLDTDETIPSTAADAGFVNFCTATNTWDTVGDVLSTGRSGGQTIRGGTAADGTLTLQATGNADMGSVTISGTPATGEPEYAFTWAPTYTRGNENVDTWFAYFNPTVTNNGTLAGDTIGYGCSGTITNTTGAGVATPQCLSADWTLATNAAVSLPLQSTFNANVTYSQAAAATTAVAQEIILQPNYLTTGAVSSTITDAYGAYYKPTLKTDDAGGTQTVTTAIAFAALDDVNSGAGTETLSTYVGFDCADLSPANSGTPICLRNRGTDDQNRLAGKTIMGSGGTSTAPAARLEVWETTNKNEVARFRTTATNSDPNYKIFQTRATAAASGTTNIDLDVTAAAPTDAPCPSNAVCLLEARTVCHCTSGASCTANEGGADVTTWTIKNNGGTVSQIGATASGNTLNAIDASLTSLTLSISSPNVRMAVVVPANYNHVCHITYILQSVET